MRFIPKHETVQKYDAILPDTLTNQAKESDAYKTYHDFATGKVIPKPKYVRRSTKKKTDQASSDSPGKRLKATAKVQMKELVFHQGFPMYLHMDLKMNRFLEVSLSNDDDDNADNEDDDGQDDDNEQIESYNDGDDFVHPKFSTHDKEERQDEQDKEEEGLNLRVQTPSHFESTDDETYDEVTQGDNVEGEELDEEETNEEEEVNELYRDVNVNLVRRDAEMTDAPQTNVQGFISNMLNSNPDTGIDFILNLNTESTSLVDVPVTTNVEMPPSSVTTLPPPPISHIQPKQQTPVSTPTIIPSTSLQNLPTFSSLFNFKDRVKALEDDFSEFKQTNLFAEAVSSILDRLRSEAQADNEDFINKIDENMKKIIKEQVKIQLVKHGPVQPWISTLAQNEDPHESFNELMDTPLDFSAFVLNRLKVDTLTLELLVGPTFELMKGSCKSLVELEYFLKEVCKETTDQLDWNNLEGQQYLHDLRKPLPLIPNSRCRRVIPFDHFINNDLAYISAGVSSRTYATSVT
ncbi:hypothetical protein Tco_1470048, partial [Tanacetum coccineum]